MTATIPMGDRGATSEARGVVAAPDRIATWMMLAQAGDEFVYATRLRMTTLPAKSAGAAAMRDLAQAGLVALFQRVAGDGEGQWRNYVARRTRRPAPRASDAGQTPAPGAADAEDAVLAVLERRAALTRPCPSIRELAQLTGLPSARCDTAMRALADAGIIYIGTVPAPTRRIVTIVTSGHQTGVAR